MYNKKGSMELSVNSIVVLVIAIVMLGLILGFVRTKFNDISKDLVKEEPTPGQATSSDPVTLSRSQIVTGSGKTFVLKVNYYNGGTADFTGNPAVTGCTPVDDPTFLSNTVKVGTSQVYTGVFKAKTTAATGTSLCKVTVNGASEEFTVEIQ